MVRVMTIFMVMAFAAGLFGCGATPSEIPPTPWMEEKYSPSPASVTGTLPAMTIIPPTITETPTADPTSTPELISSPTDTPSLSTPEPVLTEPSEATAVSTVDPFAAAIQIFAPGPMSKVSSPIDLRMYIAPRVTGLTIVELFGEDGRLMARNVLRSVNYNNQFDKVIVELPFETNAAAEVGRVQISTQDDYGIVQAVKSVHVMLLSVGNSIITNPEYLRESVALVEPPLLHYITGGDVIVQGTMQVFNELPVILELVDRQGQVLGSRMISVGPADGEYYEINTDIPYQVTQYTPARLVIRQSDNRIPGPYYLYSQQLFLSP
jgi:hypothetical protein